MWGAMSTSVQMQLTTAHHVRIALRTLDSQVTVEVIRGADGVQNLDIMTGHMEVAVREILLRE